MPDNDIGLIMCPMWDASSPQLGIPLLKAHLNSVGYSAFAFDLAIRLFNASSGVSRQALQDGDGSLLTKPAFIHQLYDEHAEVVDRCLEELLDSGAKAFGFSLYCSNLPAALTFAQRLKLRDPSRRIIVGGPECARLKEGYFRPFGMERWFDIADAVVPGEGEMALADLLERVRAGRFRAAPGAFVKQDGKFTWGGPGREVRDLDSLPFADFSDYRLADYTHPERLVTYMSRGCTRRCAFCDVQFYWGNYRSRTGRRVFDDISYQLRAHPGVRSFWFCDSVINADMKELGAFCDHMLAARSQGAPVAKWRAHAIVRPEMTKEFIGKMAAAGCEELHLGVESGSQKVLNLMRKGHDVRVAEDVLRNLHESGIPATLLLMVGFPGETEEDFQETLGFLRRAGRYAARISPSESLTYVGIGTDLHENAGRRYGIDTTSPLHSDFWRTKDGKNTFPERLLRLERLCAEARRLGLKLTDRAESTSINAGRMRAEYEEYLRVRRAERPRSLGQKILAAIRDPAGASRHYYERGKRFLRGRDERGNLI